MNTAQMLLYEDIFNVERTKAERWTTKYLEGISDQQTRRLILALSSVEKNGDMATLAPLASKEHRRRQRQLAKAQSLPVLPTSTVQARMQGGWIGPQTRSERKLQRLTEHALRNQRLPPGLSSAVGPRAISLAPMGSLGAYHIRSDLPFYYGPSVRNSLGIDPRFPPRSWETGKAS
jgi:hypothetical protein